MRTQILSRPFEVEEAWTSQYDKLATKFAERIGNKPWKIAEVGCGTGRLTVPLMKQLGNSQFVLVDRFANTRTGSYSKNYEALATNLKRAKLTRRAHVVISDYVNWIRTQHYGAYDGVISCEFLPEITMRGMRRFIQECHRVLKPGGVTVHCFWSPTPRNSRQRLVITADTDPSWTRTPPEEWFSPKPILVTSELREAGFKQVSKATFMSHLVLRGEAAKSELKRWEVRPSFYERYRKSLDKGGLEIPDWIVISGERSL
jgi:cyclopropane fatty-acyl-phospholipid synthase-like methyltransferase